MSIKKETEKIGFISIYHTGSRCSVHDYSISVDGSDLI